MASLQPPNAVFVDGKLNENQSDYYLFRGRPKANVSLIILCANKEVSPSSRCLRTTSDFPAEDLGEVELSIGIVSDTFKQVALIDY